MKRVLLLFIFFILFPLVVLAGGWQISVSNWTPSNGPNLSYEQVLIDGQLVSGCDRILLEDPKTCSTCVSNRIGQKITIRSYDTNENYTDNSLGSIGENPNPSSGGVVTVIWVTTPECEP